MVSENLKIESDLPEDSAPIEASGEKIKIVCAYCGKDLGEKEGGSGTSHGICSECFKSEMDKIKKPQNKE